MGGLNLVTLNVSIFNTPEAGLLNKSSRLVAALGVTKFIAIIATDWGTLCCAA
jgi:hypothetical protein